MGVSLEMKLAGSTVVVLLACLVAPPSAWAKNYGAINVKGYGDVYVVASEWVADRIRMHDNGFTIRGSTGIRLAAVPTDDTYPDMYWQVDLMDKHFAYTLDLSNVGCHCNAAGYFSDMPGAGGGDWGDYYCDANFVNSQWCPEYDTLESNKYTMLSTLHTCDGSPGNWWQCDRIGCGTNAFNVNSNMFCPEDRCTINTQKPFVISHHQNQAGADVWMSQEGREAYFTVCNDGGYANNMAQSYNNMVFTASIWGGPGIDMSWLDGMTGCWGECDLDNTSVTFTNFELW